MSLPRFGQIGSKRAGDSIHDQHDGSIEWVIVMAMLVVTLAMLNGFPWIEDRA